MGARKAKGCSECGAELKLGPGRCPLCGAEPGDSSATTGTRPVAIPADAYQARIRELRDQLKELKRGGAEAV